MEESRAQPTGDGFLARAWNWFYGKIVVDSGPRDADVPREYQLLYMGLVTAIASILIAMFAHHAAKNTIPEWVWLVDVALAVLCIIGGIDRFAPEDRIGSKTRWWRRFRSRYGHHLIRIGVITSVLTIWVCVKHTGGALESPFAPILTGPAIFGAFVATTWRGVAWLMAGVGVFLGWADWHAKAVSGADPYAYFVPEMTLLVAASIISIWQLVRRNTGTDAAPPVTLTSAQLQTLGEAMIRELRAIVASAREDNPEV